MPKQRKKVPCLKRKERSTRGFFRPLKVSVRTGFWLPLTLTRIFLSRGVRKIANGERS